MFVLIRVESEISYSTNVEYDVWLLTITIFNNFLYFINWDQAMAALSILIWKGFLIPFILLLLLVEVNFRFYSFTYNPVWVTWLDYNFFWKKDQWYSIHEIVSSSQQIAYILIKLLLKSSLPYFVSIQNSCWESKKSRKSMKPVIYSYGTELILLAILFFFLNK